LCEAGYRVLEAADAQEALTLASQYRQPLDLLLTDVVMPKVSGPELVDKLRKSRPDLLVLFMSGYDRKLITHRLTNDGVGFMPKPFTPQKLLAKIAEFLSLPFEESSRSVAS